MAVSTISTAEASIFISSLLLINFSRSSDKAFALLITSTGSSFSVCLFALSGFSVFVLVTFFAALVFFFVTFFFFVFVVFEGVIIILAKMVTVCNYAVLNAAVGLLYCLLRFSRSRISATDPSPNMVAPVIPGTLL